MSDRYLCKAKRTDNGEWIEGNLVWSEDADEEYRAVIIPKNKSNMFISSNEGDLGFETWYLVGPSTICQYTGLTDKNGKKIWENDICIIHSSNIDEEDGCFTVEWDGEGARFALYGEGLTVDFDNLYSYECEIMGNMFDNPELLEGREE